MNGKKFIIRATVKERYGEIAAKAIKNSGRSSCCCGGGSSCCGNSMDSLAGYTEGNLSGLPETAVNASLGCANPLLFAQLKEGETVLDLGSGGGIDVLAASKYVGKSGKVYGLDMTDEMLALANKNKAKMGVANVEFLKGYIEEIPLFDKSVDVIMSNCVINLSEDKEKALSEAFRVLKAGGRIAIADVVSLKPVSAAIRQQAEVWCGCLGGTLEVEEYKNILKKIGFQKVTVEPVSVYTKAMVKDMFLGDNATAGNVNLDEVDGAFASAHIKGVK